MLNFESMLIFESFLIASIIEIEVFSITASVITLGHMFISTFLIIQLYQLITIT